MNAIHFSFEIERILVHFSLCDKTKSMFYKSNISNKNKILFKENK
jgi:hypothetical protein